MDISGCVWIPEYEGAPNDLGNCEEDGDCCPEYYFPVYFDHLVQNNLDSQEISNTDDYYTIFMNDINFLMDGLDITSLLVEKKIYGENNLEKTLYIKFNNSNGDLVGTIELPMAIGLIGGAIASHPTAKAAVKILGTDSSNNKEDIEEFNKLFLN